MYLMYDPQNGEMYSPINNDNFIVNTPQGQILGSVAKLGVATIAHLWLNGNQTKITSQDIGNTNWINIQ